MAQVELTPNSIPLEPLPSDGEPVSGNVDEGSGLKSARELLENSNFSPRKPENSASLNFQVFGFGDFYSNHPVNHSKVDTPFSALYTFVDQNLVTVGNPAPNSGVPLFVTIPVHQHGLSVGGTITGTTPGGFAVITPPGLVVPKPFGVAYADLDGNIGAITGIWSVNQIGRLGFTVGARLIANANISGFLNDLDPTPRDLDALAPGGSVEKTYKELQGYDQHGTLNAMGINTLKDYKDAISSFSADGGFNLPVNISDLAFSSQTRVLSADVVNRQVANHLVNQMSIVNDVDGSQTAGLAQIKLDQVNKQIDVISIKLESIPYTMNSIVIGDADLQSSYESELKDLNTQRQGLEKILKHLPARFSHDIYSPEKIQDILTKHAHEEERVYLNLEDKITSTQQQLNDARHTLARTMDTDEIQNLEQTIPELKTRINALEGQKALISSSWRPEIGSEAYAVTQALSASKAKIDSIEKTLVEMSKEPIGMPLNEWQRQANFELEKSLLAELTSLHDDKRKLEGWLQTNVPIPVGKYKNQ